MATNAGFETLTIAGTAVGLNATLARGGHCHFGPLETGQVRWRDDGTDPTATVGKLLEIGDSFEYSGELTKIKFIRTGGTSGALPVTYYN
jgi:hypothetical protein